MKSNYAVNTPVAAPERILIMRYRPHGRVGGATPLGYGSFCPRIKGLTSAAVLRALRLVVDMQERLAPVSIVEGIHFA